MVVDLALLREADFVLPVVLLVAIPSQPLRVIRLIRKIVLLRYLELTMFSIAPNNCSYTFPEIQLPSGNVRDVTGV